MLKLFRYIKPSFEGDDGKFSYRRASAFVVLLLIVRMVWKGFVNSFEINALMVLSALFLLLTAIVTIDQLERFKNGAKSKED